MVLRMEQFEKNTCKHYYQACWLAIMKEWLGCRAFLLYGSKTSTYNPASSPAIIFIKMNSNVLLERFQ